MFALTAAGFTVSATDSYLEAKELLSTRPPLVLVTEIRLGAFNGLQLALRAASTESRITVVITSGFEDPVLQGEAERAGATFGLKPFTAEELLAAVYRTALRRPNPDGTIQPIRAPFERRRSERRHVHDRLKTAADVDAERRRTNRRRDIASLLVRAMLLI